MKNKLFIVTGMGRSGSTFLAESLESNGVKMGEIPPTENEILSVKDLYQSEYKTLFDAKMGELQGIKDIYEL